MKKVLFSLFLWVLCLPIMVYAQNNDTLYFGVQTSTLSNYSAPFSNYYKNAWVQCVYLADEIGAIGTINKIAFKNASTVSQTIDTFTIYMAHTSNSTFANTSSWIPQADLVEVCSGSNLVIPVSTEWLEIELTTPFSYNGIQNLAVICSQHSTTVTQYAKFIYTAATNKVLYRRSDSDVSYAQYPLVAGSLSAFRPNMRMLMNVTSYPCIEAQNFAVSDLSDESVTVSWDEHGGHTGYDLVILDTLNEGADPSTGTIVVPTGTSYEFEGLQSATVYAVYLRVHCDEGVTLPWQVRYVKTLAVPAEIPYGCDFEDAGENFMWSTTRSANAQWFVGSAANNTPDGQNAMYISNDNGASNVYNFTTNCTTSVYRDIVFPESENNIALKFDWKGVGQASYDAMRVYVGPPSVALPDSALPSTAGYRLIGSANYNLSDSWQSETIILPRSMNGSTYRLVFTWVNNNTTGQNPPAAIDNISLEDVYCNGVDSVIANNATANSVDLNIYSISSDDFIFWYEKTGDANPVHDTISITTPYTLTGLQAGTYYTGYFMTDCGDETGEVFSYRFRTDCGAITDLPWDFGFETVWMYYPSNDNNARFPYCWSMANGGICTGTSTISPLTYNWRNSTTASYIHSGSGTAYFSGTSSRIFVHNDYLITPVIQLTGDDELSFWMRGNTTSTPSASYDYTSRLCIAISTGSTDTASFVKVAGPFEKVGTTSTTFEQFKVRLQGYVGDVHLAFLVDTISYSFSIDDIRVSEYNSCATPSNVSISYYDYRSAKIEWFDTVATTHVIEYGENGFTLGTGTQITVSDTDTYYLEGLLPGTTYQVYVLSDCGGTSSDWSPVTTFTTGCAPVAQLPYSESFDDYGTGSTAFPTCWYYGALGTTSMPYVNTTNHSAPGSLYMYTTATQTKMAAFAVDPALSVSTMSAMMYFRATSTTNSIKVYVADNYSDTSTYTLITTFSATATGVWEPKEINFENYSGTGTFIVLASQGALTAYIDDFQLFYTPSCARPDNVAISDLTAHSVTVSWDEQDDVSQWTVEYGANGFTQGTGTTITATTNSAVISNLNASTLYDVYVQANCGAEESIWSFVSSFRTPCDAIDSLPYTENFDSYATGTSASISECWSRYNTYSTSNYPYVSATYFSSAPNSIYFYSSSTSYNILTLPAFSTPINELQISFKLRKTSAAYQLMVGIVSNPSDINTFDTIAVFSPSALNVFEEFTVRLNDYEGSGSFIAFVSNTGATNIIYLDDVEVSEIPLCASPLHLNAVSITSSEAIIGWDEDDTPTSWYVEYDTTGFTLGTGTSLIVTENPAIIPNLNPHYTYDVYVRSNCGSSESEFSDVFTFTTSCAATQTIPYVENFDTYGAGSTANYPTCWERPILYSGYPYIVSTYNVTAPSSLRLNSSTVTPTYAVTQALDYDINRLQVSFYLRKSSTTSGVVEVGLMSNASDTSTFELLQSFDVPVTSVWTPYRVTFNNASLSGTGNHVAFRHKALSTGSYYFLDSVVVDVLPSCPPPTHLSAQNITTVSADLTWLDNASSSYEIAWGLSGFNIQDAAFETSSTLSLPLSGLTPNTAYSFYVRSVCSDSENSEWAGPFDFRTSCDDYLTIPYSENFDTYGTGITSGPQTYYPVCWTRMQTNTATTSYPYITTTFYSSPASLYLYTNLNNYTTAVLPQLEPSATVDQLLASFYLRKTAVAYNVKVGVMTDPDDMNTFIAVDTVSPVALNTWELFEVNFSNYSDTGRYIAFVVDGRDGSTKVLYLDDLTIDYLPSCLRPFDIAASNITATSADISWSASPQSTQFIIEYGIAGFEQGSGNIITSTTPSVSLSLLDGNTQYTLYVRSICSATDTSDWSFDYSFRTACVDITTLPYVEYFDSYSPIITSGLTSTFPNCWTRGGNYSATTSYPYISSTTPSSSPGSLYFYSGSTSYSYAATPRFDNIPVNQLNITCRLKVTSASYKMVVGVMTNPSDINTFVAVDTVTNTTTSIWVEHDINLSSYSGTGEYIAFLSRNTGSTNIFYLDNVYITYIPTCIRPASLAVNGITENSISFLWTERNTPAATSWVVEYGAEGFALGSGTQVTVNSNPATITGLSDATGYQFYVKSSCSSDDASEYSDPVSCTTLCYALSTLPYSENFDSYTGTTYSTAGVTPACWVSYSDNTSYPRPHITSSGSYCYIHSLPNTFAFTAGSAGNHTYAVLPHFTQPLYNLKLTFWRQMENATYGSLKVGYVTDAGDVSSFVQVAAIPSLTGTGDTVSVDFSALEDIPSDGIMAFYWNAATSFYTCCIDDIYIQQVAYSAACDAPSNVLASSVTSASAVISWTPGGTETAWIMEYKESTESSYTQVSVTTNPTFSMSGLSPLTSYDVRVKTVCPVGQSSYSALIHFTTLPAPACNVPTNVAASSVTESSAVITWTAGGTETAWTVDYKKSTDVNFTSLPVSNTPTTTLTSLQASTDYAVRVKALCGDNNESEYTELVSFRTEDVAPIYYNVSATAAAGGTISPSGVISVAVGEDISFTITPDDNYAVSSLLIDGNAETAQTTYTFFDVQADHSIYAEFINVGIRDNILYDNISLYPNPADTKLELIISNNAVTVNDVAIYDVYGKLIKNIVLHDNKAVIDVDNFADGIYFVRIVIDNTVINKKFVKQ